MSEIDSLALKDQVIKSMTDTLASKDVIIHTKDEMIKMLNKQVEETEKSNKSVADAFEIVTQTTNLILSEKDRLLQAEKANCAVYRTLLHTVLKKLLSDKETETTNAFLNELFTTNDILKIEKFCLEI